MTSYQLEDKFARLIERTWRPLDAVADPSILPNRISETGKILVLSKPIEGPERDSERFFSTIWNSAKPLRWKVVDDSINRRVIIQDGLLAGEIGFHFQFVRDRSKADGIDYFFIPWEII